MKTRRNNLILMALIVLVPTGVGAWIWKTWPARQQQAVRKALEGGDADRAEELLKPLLQDQPDDPTVGLLYTQVLRKQHRYAEAELVLKQAVEHGLGPERGMRELALLLAGQDWPKDAEGILQKVVKDHPSDVEVLETLARGYARRKRWPDCEQIYTRLIELQPDVVEHHFQRGIARQERTFFEKAAVDFREVLARNPEHFHARLLLAHCLLSDAQMAEAESELLSCRKLRPDRFEPLVGLATCALERNDLKSAEEWLGKALALDSSSPLVLHEVVNLHLRQSRYGPAEQVLEFLLRTSPNDKQVHLKLAQLYRRKGDTERAARHQQRYQQLDQLEDTQARGMR